MVEIEIHVEAGFHALTLPETWDSQELSRMEGTLVRLNMLLERVQRKATFYFLGDVAARRPNIVRGISKHHSIGNHGYWHRHGEYRGDNSYYMAASAIFSASEKQLNGPYPYRSPYWDTTPRPGKAGGFFFRFLPYALLLREVRQYQRLWLHPHDLVPDPVPGEPWRRKVMFCKPWERLERLLNDTR